MVKIDSEIFPLVLRPNERYIGVARTKYSRTTLFLVKYLMIYDFQSRELENFDFF